MRGKNILWLTLIAMLLSVSLVNLGVAQPTPTLAALPSLVTDPKVPGDSFNIGIRVSDVSNLYAFELHLSFAPYMSILAVTDIKEGPLLKTGGETYMAKILDPFTGEVRMGVTLLGDVPGVYGTGILAIVSFMILEAGECALDLHDTALVDPDGNYMTHNVVDAYYLGPTADLIPPDLPTQRPIGGGLEQALWKKTMVKRFNTEEVFTAQVVNTGYAPLWARIRYTSVNEHTGEVVDLYSGQAYLPTVSYRTEILYVNDVGPHPWEPYFYEWTNYGTSPYLDAPDDGSYTEGYQDAALSNVFQFEDITLGPVDTIDNVKIEGYCRADSTDVDMDVYTWGPVPMAWLGSLWGDPTYSWKSPRWIGTDVSDEVPLTLTEAGLNDLAVALYYYAPWEDPAGSEGPASCDSLRLIVTIRTGGVVPAVGPWYFLDVGETLTLPAVWYLEQQNTGKWYTTISMEYRYLDPSVPSILYQVGPTTLTYEWWIKGEGVD